MNTSAKKLALLTILFALPAMATLHVGDKAPAFSLKDSQGKVRNLADFKGKWVVLEWFNNGCPFVRKHYESHNMQDLQTKYTGKGVVWLTIASSKKGKEGYLTEAGASEIIKTEKAAMTALLLDGEGKAGKAYDAKTTPHMFVINPEGKVVYMGAIDSKKSADKEDIATSTNYVATALDEAMSGKAITTASTTPYGCSIKY